ncbi:MAG: hypothetical protein ACHRXM_35645 [Isosphaerales bacterium]
MAIDLKQSTTARVLGFDSRNAVGAPGSWSDVIDWSAPFDAVSIRPGRLTNTADPTKPRFGNVVLFDPSINGAITLTTTAGSFTTPITTRFDGSDDVVVFVQPDARRQHPRRRIPHDRHRVPIVLRVCREAVRTARETLPLSWSAHSGHDRSIILRYSSR